MAQDFRNTLNRVIGTGDTTILTAGNYDAVKELDVVMF